MTSKPILLAVLLTVGTVACGGAEPAAAEDNSNAGALTQLSDDTDPFSDVQQKGALCFAKTYTSDHLKSHTAQTVMTMNVTLYYEFDRPVARLIFMQKGASTDKVRELACDDKNGETWCTDSQCSVKGPTIKIEKAAIGNTQGLRVFNLGGVRVDETCERATKVLSKERDADDIFELPLMGACNAPTR